MGQKESECSPSLTDSDSNPALYQPPQRIPLTISVWSFERFSEYCRKGFSVSWNQHRDTTTTAHQNGGPPELGEDGDAAAKADENMTLDSSKSIALALEAERDFFEKPSVLRRKSTVLWYSIPDS
ncbi:hypothetical protein LENED_004235 [Lentinula edodes]|uniref:Uncharacterized protein n=1 Tax=Lentinula edodes TaxID=5353 RepID=A0A1Q3E5P1_LENED|nr:hypothetical protein LENED_004235 [Lentinula edodes]